MQLTTDQDHVLVAHSTPPSLESTLPSDMLVSLLPSRLKDSDDDKTSSNPSPSPTPPPAIVAEPDNETAESKNYNAVHVVPQIAFGCLFYT